MATIKNFRRQDNGAVLECIKDYAQLIKDEAFEAEMIDYFGRLMACIETLEQRRSFESIKDRRD